MSAEDSLTQKDLQKDVIINKAKMSLGERTKKHTSRNNMNESAVCGPTDRKGVLKLIDTVHEVQQIHVILLLECL